jgi:hypothetical protein
MIHKICVVESTKRISELKCGFSHLSPKFYKTFLIHRVLMRQVYVQLEEAAVEEYTLSQI